MKPTTQYERDAARAKAQLLADVQAFVAAHRDDAYTTYAGRPGCMCGCNGKYAVASGHKAFADENRGYVTDDTNDRSVNGLLNKLTRFSADQVDEVELSEPYGDPQVRHVYVERSAVLDHRGRVVQPGRCWAAYFKVSPPASA